MIDNRADLHTHTSFSDGQMTPAALIEEAVWKGLSAIAVTDHDTIGGIAEAEAAGRSQMIDVIPGIELSCELDGRETHILGYCFSAPERLAATTTELRERRYERMKKMILRLAPLGIRVTLEEVAAEARNRIIGRPHLARVMVAKGYVSSVGQAFSRYIGDECPGNVPKDRLTVREGIDLIHAAGGVAVLAHACTSRLETELPRIVELGIEGLEVYHPDHQAAHEELLLKAAADMNLLVTGGSDYHGTGFEGRLLGTRFVPFEHVEKLRERARMWKGA